MSCPFHKTKFVNHKVWVRSFFSNEGLPVKDTYDHYNCSECTYNTTGGPEWIIIDGQYYHYKSVWELIRVRPERPRKGKIIGTKVYQP